MPDELIAAVITWTSPKGKTFDLPPSLPKHLAKKITVGLLLVTARKREGAELDTCLNQAYDVFASVLMDHAEPLTDEMRNETIPSWVLHWAVVQRWLQPLPASLATGATLGDLELSDVAKRDILQRLAGRLAYWQAEALAATPEQPKQSEPVKSSALPTAPDGSDRHAQIDDFIARVFEDERKHINKTHIWKAGGYKEATQFERFQSGKKTTKRSFRVFTTILAMTPSEFVDKLKRMKLLE